MSPRDDADYRTFAAIRGSQHVGDFMLSTVQTPVRRALPLRLVLAYDAIAGTTTVYVDGVGTTQAAMGNSPQPITILNIGNISEGGSNFAPGTGGNYFAGTIDEVRVYARALAADEVRALFEGRE